MLRFLESQGPCPKTQGQNLPLKFFEQMLISKQQRNQKKKILAQETCKTRAEIMKQEPRAHKGSFWIDSALNLHFLKPWPPHKLTHSTFITTS